MVLPDVAFDHVHCRSNVFATVESKPVPIALHNARHERFAQGLADGKTQAEAYIDAGFSPKNARANASALLQNNPGIVERREQLLRTRAQCNFAVVSGIAVQEHCTLEAHLATLAQLRDEAQAKGNYGSAISAEYKRGQALGLYIERKEHGKPGQFTARTRQRRTSSGKRSSPRLRLSRRSGRPRRAQDAFEPLEHVYLEYVYLRGDGRALVRRWHRTGANVRCALVRMLSRARNHTTLCTSAEVTQCLRMPIDGTRRQID